MSTPEPVVSLSSPAKLIAAVPYLLKYVPTERLVFIGLSDEGGRILVTGSIRLSDVFDHTPQLAQLATGGVTAIVLIGYGTGPQVTPAIEHLQSLVERHDIEVVDAIRVTDGRYWSYHCRDITCCPIEGTLLQADTDVDTAFIAAGSAVEPNREAIAAYLDPAPDAPAVTTAIAAMDEPIGEHEGVFEYAMEEASAGRMPSIDQTAMLGRRLATRGGIDAAVTAIDALDSDVDRVRLWIWLTRHLSGEYRAHAAAVCGYAAWQSGNGALAGDAVNVALSIQPQHRLARVARLALDNAIAPHTVLDTPRAP